MALPQGFMGARAPQPQPNQHPVGLIGLTHVVVHKSRGLEPPASFWVAPGARKLFDRAYTVDRSHTPPYVAGYSNDGHCIYLHKDFPKQIDVNGKKFDPTPFVILHERVEKAMLDWTREHDGKQIDYKTAHNNYATQAEHEALKAQLGFTDADIRSYDATMKQVAMKLARQPNKEVPAAIDKTPYRDTDKMHAVSWDKMMR